MKRESGKIPLDMGRETKAGCGGRGSNSGQGGKGRRGRNSTMLGSVPSKATEVGDCKDLGGHIFTIGSGNKGKDGDMFRTSMEKMAKSISTKFGDSAAQEWTSGKQIVLQEPAYLQVILVRHAERVKATRDQLNLKLTSVRIEKVVIKGEIAANPCNHCLRREMQKVNDNIAKTQFKVKDDVDMKLTNNERTAHNEA
jgi:hypothetical protein